MRGYNQNLLVRDVQLLPELLSVHGIVGVRIGIDTNTNSGSLLFHMTIVKHVLAEVIRGVDRAVEDVNEGIAVACITAVLPLGGLGVNVVDHSDPGAVILDQRHQQVSHLAVAHEYNVGVSGLDQVGQEVGV